MTNKKELSCCYSLAHKYGRVARDCIFTLCCAVLCCTSKTDRKLFGTSRNIRIDSVAVGKAQVGQFPILVFYFFVDIPYKICMQYLFPIFHIMYLYCSPMEYQ